MFGTCLKKDYFLKEVSIPNFGEHIKQNQKGARTKQTMPKQQVLETAKRLRTR